MSKCKLSKGDIIVFDKPLKFEKGWEASTFVLVCSQPKRFKEAYLWHGGWRCADTVFYRLRRATLSKGGWKLAGHLDLKAENITSY